MAYFDKKSGEIVLSEEDKEMFKEISRNASTGKTPWANSILKAILPQYLHDGFNLSKHE